MSSVGSSLVPDPRHLALIQASAAGNELKVRQIIEETAWQTPMDRDALRQSLQRVAARGNFTLATLLVEKGADVNIRRENEASALFKACEGGHEKLAQLLLDNGANTEVKDRDGRTALYKPAMRGHLNICRLLLERKANPDSSDKEGRTVLIHLAAEKPGKWEKDMVDLLLHYADIEAKDDTRRTALIWAAATGKAKLVDTLLSGEKRADTSASNNRGRTALMFASENNHVEVVQRLLVAGADPRAVSDGGWTALHNAADKGHVHILELLLATDCNVNSTLSNGMTPLHWAAFNGHEHVVKLILAKVDALGRPEADLAIKDTFDRTPMLCAAENYHSEIVQLLQPGRIGYRVPLPLRCAMEGFDATVWDFGGEGGAFRDGKKQLHFKHSVYDLLYGWNVDTDKPKVPTQVKNIKHQPAFRWIHLPANNIAWVETLLAKSFIEGGLRDHEEIEDFKALEKCFSQEHRGHTPHAHFMRPWSQRYAVQHRIDKKPKPPSDSLPLAEPALEESAATLIVTPPDAAPPPTTRKPQPSPVRDGTPKSDKKKKTKGEVIQERHAKKPKPANGQNADKSGKQARTVEKVKGGAPKVTPEAPGSNGKIVLFMPFLHYETDKSRRKMAASIKLAQNGQECPHTPSRDDLLVQAYLRAKPPLHPRRTLDQFSYHGIDTSQRDEDQVVYRYLRERGVHPAIFMVDQLWVFILGKELIVTCFPERWEQPRNDPMMVLDGIVEDMNAKTRPPINSVYDLALLITSRCCGVFDRHKLDNVDFQFLDMFESSIGKVTNQETKLFSSFNIASAQATKWLRTHRRARGSRLAPGDNLKPGEREQDYDSEPVFVDKLLEIGTETKLLAEIKDIKDELRILDMVLQSQLQVLPGLADHIVDELGGKTKPQGREIERRKREQLKLIEVHIKDLERMKGQATSVEASLAHLLDLKQKHANAFEARFARDQAQLTAKQGQTILVFTIVTIIFLPMSFIAAFFAIPFAEFSQSGNPSLHLSFVARYMFPIGFAVSVPLIAIALAVDDVGIFIRKVRTWFSLHIFRRQDQYAEPTLEKTTRELVHLDPRVSNVEKSLFADEDGLNGTRSRNYGFGFVEEDFSPAGLRPRTRRGSEKITWAKASFERVRGRISGDLERGRTGW
ncbi:putative electron transfer flavoprotein subunit alpha [Venturia nashicola]|nr:putative electron transfer flavoprotein subunit alpha [Venturia nashicola]